MLSYRCRAEREIALAIHGGKGRGSYFKELDMTANVEERKSTSLAKFLKILRVQNDELLGNMADRLGIKPSYLSSIEANRRPLTDELSARVAEAYSLDEEQRRKLSSCVAEANRTVEVSLDSVQDEALLPEYVDTALLFAKDLSKMSSVELGRIKDLLNEFHKDYTKEGSHSENRNRAKA